jgi:hypothetical protein
MSMPNESQAIEDENAADREVREHRARLVYVLRLNGFPAMAAVFAALGQSEEREYVGEPAPTQTRRLQTMAFSDVGLNLFRPPPMAGGARSAQPVREVAPLFVDSTQPSDAERRARVVLAQRGIHRPSEEQVQEVLRAAPWLGSSASKLPPTPSETPPAPFEPVEPTL